MEITLLKPLNIKIDDYENYWEEFAEELSVDVKGSKIRNL